VKTAGSANNQLRAPNPREEANATTCVKPEARKMFDE